MNFLVHTIPFVGLVLAEVASVNPESKLMTYGPMGIICLWLIYRDERTRIETGKQGEALREEMRGVVHQMKGLNRNLLYVTASHGPPGLKEVAKAQLQKEMDEGGPNNPFL